MATSTSSPRSAFWSVPDSPQSHSHSPPHSATESVPVADIWDPVSPPPTQKYPKLTPPSSATSSKGKSVAFADDEQADPNLKAKRIKLVPFVIDGANSEGDNDEVEDDENEEQDRVDDRRFKLQFHVNDVIQLQNAFAGMANSFSALLGNTPKTSAIIQALPTQSSKPTSLKRTLQKEKRPFKKTGWNYFRVVKARELHAQGVKTSVKSLGEIWSSMSKEEKEEYTQLAKEEEEEGKASMKIEPELELDE
ncbi:hypothetical protein HDU79_001578 [Rhizoclosmatium sp. JEL0117]|nr:hypothetical protein HDU79_001578 [Rhizoclosmatium sp. JEL0117]